MIRKFLNHKFLKFLRWFGADVRVHNEIVLLADLVIPKDISWFIEKHGVIVTNGYRIYVGDGKLYNYGVIRGA